MAVFDQIQRNTLALSTLLILWLGITTHHPALAQALSPKTLSYKVLQKRPHESRSFTQGLIYSDDTLYESSGLYGRSFLYQYETQSNSVLQIQALPKNIFAEGLTLFDSHLYLISWKMGKAWVYSPKTLKQLKSFQYDGEGWGLTHNNTQLIMSDGTNKIRFRDPKTFATTKTILTTYAGRKLTNINELEFARGLIWANVWQQNNIVAINPDNGVVVAEIDLSPLVKVNSSMAGQTVLNGIAYNQAKDTFWVTGKLWPSIYEIQIEALPANTAH